MKKHFDRTLLLYVLLGLLNYAFCNAVMLLFNIAFHLPETPSLILEFALQTVISFILNRFVTFRHCRLSRLWPLYSLLVVGVCYLIAKVLLRDVFYALLQTGAMTAAAEWLRGLFRIGMEPALFREKLVMLLCTFTYCTINYFGQRYLVFRPDTAKQEGEKRTMNIGLIWDLDGTLWDSGEWVSVSWNEYCKAHGIDRRFTPDDCRSYCGKTLGEIAAVVFPDSEPQWREAVIVACCDAECVVLAEHGGRLYDGLLPTLEALHAQYHMSVVSNCGLGYIESFYAGNHTKRYFDDEENAARTGKGKADNIRLVMERNQLDRAIYIGDTQGDYNAAAQAGVEFIHAAYGFGMAPEAKWRVRQPSELPAVISQIVGQWNKEK